MPAPSTQQRQPQGLRHGPTKHPKTKTGRTLEPIAGVWAGLSYTSSSTDRSEAPWVSAGAQRTSRGCVFPRGHSQKQYYKPQKWARVGETFTARKGSKGVLGSTAEGGKSQQPLPDSQPHTCLGQGNDQRLHVWPTDQHPQLKKTV